jgi:uncharacterized protein YigA (DUF484 family)
MPPDMPAAALRKPSESAPKAPAPRLTPARVLAWLQAHPEFFTAHSEHLANQLSDLALPAKRGNVLSLHAARATKAATAAERLALRQQRLVATARANAQVADAIFTAVIGLLACKNLAELRHLVQTSLKRDLDLDATRLLLISARPSATTLTAAQLNELCPEPVKLRTLTDPLERKFYGPKGNMLQSDALLRLAGPDGQPLGLLALASHQTTRFHAGQSTELAAFLAAALGTCLAKLNG